MAHFALAKLFDTRRRVQGYAGTSENPGCRFRSSGLRLLTKPYRKAELARVLRLCLDRAIDHMGDPIPLPYSVQEDLERFLRENPPEKK